MERTGWSVVSRCSPAWLSYVPNIFPSLPRFSSMGALGQLVCRVKRLWKLGEMGSRWRREMCVRVSLKVGYMIPNLFFFLSLTVTIVWPPFLFTKDWMLGNCEPNNPSSFKLFLPGVTVLPKLAPMRHCQELLLFVSQQPFLPPTQCITTKLFSSSPNGMAYFL